MRNTGSWASTEVEEQHRLTTRRRRGSVETVFIEVTFSEVFEATTHEHLHK